MIKTIAMFLIGEDLLERIFKRTPFLIFKTIYNIHMATFCFLSTDSVSDYVPYYYKGYKTCQ